MWHQSIRAACQPVASASRAPELRATAGPVDCVLTTDYVNGRNHSEASGEKLVSTFPRGPEGAEATWPGPWGFGVCQQKLPAQPLLPNPSPGETAWGRESQLGEQTQLWQKDRSGQGHRFPTLLQVLCELAPESGTMVLK